MAIDLHVSSSNISFPNSIALNEVSSFTVEILNIGTVVCSADFIVTLTISPSANLNQRFKFEYLWPGSATIAAASASNSQSFEFSPAYNYIVDPLFGIPGEISAGVYDLQVEVNTDAEGTHQLAEQFYLNNVVSAGTFTIGAEVENSSNNPGFNQNYIDPGVSGGYDEGSDEGENFCAITFSGDNGLYFSDFELKSRERLHTTPPFGNGEPDPPITIEEPNNPPSLNLVSVPREGQGVGRTWLIDPVEPIPLVNPSIPEEVVVEVEVNIENVPPFSFTGGL